MVSGMSAEAAEIWERQPNESSKAYAAFCIYRDLGPRRSQEAVRQKFLEGSVKISRRLLDRWSSKYGWVERARAYDDHLDRLKRESKEKEIQEMADRHAREAVALQQKALERLRGLDPTDLTPRDVLNYLVEAIKVERLSRGEPGDIVKQQVELPPLLEVVLPPDEDTEETS